MIKDFILPDIGEGIVECEVVDWLVAEGDWVEEDQAICDVMTDKALVQIPAKEAGQICRLYYQKGQLAQVDAPLFALEVEAEMDAVANPSANVKLTADPSLTDESPDENNGVSDVMADLILPAMTEASPTETSPTRAQGKALASPAVRRLAREHELDLAQVAGSGKHGRVYKEDIERYLQSASEHPDLGSASAPFSFAAQGRQDRIEPITGMRAVMAKQMTESAQRIPHFTYCDEFDVTELLCLRAELNAQYEQENAALHLTLMPFFIKALSLALTEYPLLNSRVNADCTELTYLADHNIGVAVDGKLGLLVPNIKQVQHKSLLDIAHEMTRLTAAARAGQIEPADLKQGTISISNIGALGGTVAVPVIHSPEVAIVALGRVQPLPRFTSDGAVVARNIMAVSWSGDHRVIDGATMARFCNRWKHYLEHPSNMLMAMR